VVRSSMRLALDARREQGLLDRIRWTFVLLGGLVAASAPVEAAYSQGLSGPARAIMVIAYLGLGVWAVAMQEVRHHSWRIEAAPLVLLTVGGVAGGDPDAVLGRMVLAVFLHALYRPSRRRLFVLGTSYTVMITVVGAVLGDEAESAIGYLIGIFTIYAMIAILQQLARALQAYELARRRDAVLSRTVGTLLEERDTDRLDPCVAQGLWELLDDPDGLATVWTVVGDTLVPTAVRGELPGGLEPTDVGDLPAHLQDAFHQGERREFGVEAADWLRGVAGTARFVAVLSVPVIERGSLRGAVSIASVRPLDADLVPVLHRFADEVALSQRLAQREQLLAGIVTNSPDLVVMLDAAGRLTFVSSAVHDWIGREADELEGQSLGALLRRPTDGRPVEVTQLSAGSAMLFELTDPPRCRDRTTPVEVEVTANVLADGSRVLSIRDITERRVLEAEITHRAFHDGVTGLPNRAFFLDRLAELARGSPPLSTKALVLLDLDDFKRVNDTYGHAAGDVLLAEVGQRLRDCVRLGDFVARLGGDEFAVVVTELDGPDHALTVVERMLKHLTLPLMLEDRLIRVSGSAGLVMVDASPGDALLRNADLAMYAAKALGKNRVALFHPQMHDEVLAVQELRAELETAIAQRQIVVHYQPIVDVATGWQIGVEALARWNHPRLGTVAPERFIAVAEQTGLIVPLGRHILNEACAEVASWSVDADAARPELSVNVSAIQLRDPGLVREVSGVLERSALQPAQLTLEITETALFDDREFIVQTLTELRQLGVRIAIDDFGTGYSSISHLSTLPVDLIKVDRMFVAAIGASETNSRLAEAIVKLARTLQLPTVAEGVEHGYQQDELVSWGCTRAQGWYWSPAQSAGLARARWASSRPAHDRLERAPTP